MSITVDEIKWCSLNVGMLFKPLQHAQVKPARSGRSPPGAALDPAAAQVCPQSLLATQMCGAHPCSGCVLCASLCLTPGVVSV